MSRSNLENYSLLLLRLMVVIIFLYHGIPKAIFWPAASQKFVEMGFPGFLGPITGIVETILSVFVLVGIYSRFSNLVFAFIMAGALTGVHIPDSIAQGILTAGLERDLMLIVGVLVLAAFGPGAWSISSKDLRQTQEVSSDHL